MRARRQRRLRPSLVAAAVTLAGSVLLSSCTSGATDAPGTDAVDTAAATLFDLPTMQLCDLFSTAEIEKAFGEAVSVDDSNSGECWWETRTRLKTLVVKRSSAPDSIEGIEERRAGFDNSSWEPIDLGKEGFRGKVVPSVDWLIGDQNIEVNLAWSTKGDPLPIVEKLARLADRRIVHPS